MATHYGQLQEFLPESEDIATYLQRVDLYFVANEISSRKQVPIFLNSVGAKVYGLLRSLVAPDDPKDKSMADLVEVLQSHYEPKRNVVAERFHFHRRNQHSGESISDYVAELRRMATRCSFDSAYLEEVLRDFFYMWVTQ